MPSESLRLALADPDPNGNCDANFYSDAKYYTDAKTYAHTEESTNTSVASYTAASALRPVVNGRFSSGTRDHSRVPESRTVL